MKWRELKAQGVQRCCAHFTDGTRCRRRAKHNQAHCQRCEEQYQRQVAPLRAMLREANKIMARPNEDETED
jgi:hypothetical protein